MIYNFIENENGKTVIGGEIPELFTMPSKKGLKTYNSKKTIDLLEPIVYLGKLSCNEKPFSKLWEDLHLICPIYSTFEYFYVDYSITNKPKIIYISGYDSNSHLEYINADTNINFNTKEFSLEMIENEVDDYQDFGFGRAGEPFWQQSNEPPTNPYNDIKLEYVCQLNTYNDITAKNHNIDFNFEENTKLNIIEIKKMVQEQSFSIGDDEIVEMAQDSTRDTYNRLTSMNFWGSGSLYVFANYKEKIVCYFIQNT